LIFDTLFLILILHMTDYLFYSYEMLSYSLQRKSEKKMFKADTSQLLRASHLVLMLLIDLFVTIVNDLRLFLLYVCFYVD